MIVGRLIPAGTGAFMNQMREIAADRERELAEIAAVEERPQLTDESGEEPAPVL